MARALSYAGCEFVTFPSSSTLRTLTDEELCGRWRSSYALVQRPATTEQMAETVAERQRCLDELERRHTQGFASWLASGARAPGNPLPHLLRPRADRATNWDELTRGQDR